MVFATAVRLLGNASDAEDAAQTVFLRAFQQFEALDGNPAAPGWLKTTTRDVCLNHLSRYRSRWRLFSEMTGRDDETDGSYAATLASPSPQVDDLEEADEAARIERAKYSAARTSTVVQSPSMTRAGRPVMPASSGLIWAIGEWSCARTNRKWSPLRSPRRVQ